MYMFVICVSFTIPGMSTDLHKPCYAKRPRSMYIYAPSKKIISVKLDLKRMHPQRQNRRPTKVWGSVPSRMPAMLTAVRG